MLLTLVISSFGAGFIFSWVQIRRHGFPALKRAVDVILALLMLLIFGPPMLLLGLMVKITSSGPTFYKQERSGMDGRPFTLLKLRSMVANAEGVTGPVWAAQADPRVTPLGQFLRDHHLDELPQLVNVVKGDMSLVGPRPERPVFVDSFVETIPQYPVRLTVKPGITGLAQVKHKADETADDVKEKLVYDIDYVRNMNLVLDLKILVATVRKVFYGLPEEA